MFSASAWLGNLPIPQLSIFPLTVTVQLIALEAAETLGVNPDTFRMDVSGHQAWDRIKL